jgi:galactonate dehydratase
MITMSDARRVARAYSLARESLGDEIDIIVHCHAELDVPSAVKVAEAIEPIKPLFYEDPLAPYFSEGWMALRRQTRLPILTGENLALIDEALPFIQNQAVSCLQPDLMNAGGITGTKLIADMANVHRMPVCLHNVSGLVLDMASQQFSAAIANCPMMESRRRAAEPPEAAANAPDIRDGKVRVSTRPGLGLEMDEDYLKSARLDGEPWWDEQE